MRYILIILVFLSVGAKAQMVIKAHPNYVPFASANLLLDDYPNAAAAYSLRKLDNDYTGSAIRVRKDTTGQPEQDIGFTAGGDLDTASLKSFLNARSGFVVTWYSQGDSSAVNFTQSTAASQPRIANAGVIDRRNGKPSLFFDGINDFMDISSSTQKFAFLHQTGQSAVNVVALIPLGTTTYTITDNANISSGNTGYMLYTFTTNQIWSNISRGVNLQSTSENATANNFTTNNTLFSIFNELDNNNATASNRNKLYYNNGSAVTNNTFTNTPSAGNASFNMRLARRANAATQPFSGSISELTFWKNNQSSNRNGIITNINNYYGIY